MGRGLTRSFLPALVLGYPTHAQQFAVKCTQAAETMGDRLEAWDRSGTSANAGEEVPGPRAYARRWVFLLAVSLLSCSNAMVFGRWDGRGGVFQAASFFFFFFASSREPTFLLAQEVVKDGVNTCSAWEGTARGDRSVSLKVLNPATCCFLLIPPPPPNANVRGSLFNPDCR